MSAIPTVYFIDDSATMREVIKIAFRRENINVVACHDAVSALAEIETAKPDLVITDVIMPDKDGYDVCQYIKAHPDLKKTPVVLMSGVVNRAVAEKAFAVKADELLRKPFQPQDLIARVKHLLQPNTAPTAAAAASAAVALSSIFSPAAPIPPRSSTPSAPNPAARPAVVLGGTAASASGPTSPVPSTNFAANVPSIPIPAGPVPAPAPAKNASNASTNSQAPLTMPAIKPTNGFDGNKLRVEVLRLEGLVKKLQIELQAEREYSRALEAHIKTLQESDK
jgi:CheY-like chemotaxis protein